MFFSRTFLISTSQTKYCLRFLFHSFNSSSSSIMIFYSPFNFWGFVCTCIFCLITCFKQLSLKTLCILDVSISSIDMPLFPLFLALCVACKNLMPNFAWFLFSRMIVYKVATWEISYYLHQITFLNDVGIFIPISILFLINIILETPHYFLSLKHSQCCGFCLYNASEGDFFL